VPAPEESEAESDVQPVLAVGGRSAAGQNFWFCRGAAGAIVDEPEALSAG